MAISLSIISCAKTEDKVEESGGLTPDEISVLRVCEQVQQVFNQHKDTAWPGYNLRKQPFIVYYPEKWALLFNYTTQADGFEPYPSDWPGFDAQVSYFQGKYDGLGGQLAFYIPVDTIEVAAVGYRGQMEPELFKYIVHEAFHQYQYEHFGDIPWEREQKYPIEDRENTALACLEMRILSDAVMAAGAEDKAKCIGYIEQFIAVRGYRWNRGDEFIRSYEQGQEINEGTARYVESKSVSILGKVRYKSTLLILKGANDDGFETYTLPDIIISDMNGRFTGNSISPEDMPRNRIYPLGSAQGYLLDFLGVDWKSQAQAAGTDFTYTGLMKKAIKYDENRSGRLLETAKKKYDYDAILSSSDSLVTTYVDGYKDAMREFESQPGYRVEISLGSNGVMRSRSSRARKWVVDKGSKEFCPDFNIYTLKTDSLYLQVDESGLLEENDWDKRIKTVIFYTPESISISLDDQPVKADIGRNYEFRKIEISGDNLKLEYSGHGSIDRGDMLIKIDLVS